MSPFDDRINQTSVDSNPPYYASYSTNGNNYIMRQNNTPPPVRIPFCALPQPNKISNTQKVEAAEQLDRPGTCEDLLEQYEKDLELFLSLYSFNIKRLLTEIQKEINRLDHEGSFIYDKIPDRSTILTMVDYIHKQILPLTYTEEMESPILTNDDDMDDLPDKLPSAISSLWLKHLIEILVYQELIERRRKYYEVTRR